MGFSRKEYWSGLPGPSPVGLSGSGMEPMTFVSPALADGFFTTSTTWEAQTCLVRNDKKSSSTRNKKAKAHKTFSKVINRKTESEN